ncbi:MAG: RluA family pseudouridine synthase [Anaerolineae bacterium]
MPPEQACDAIAVTAGATPERIDVLVARALGVSRAAAQRAIAAGRVTVDGEAPLKSLIPEPGAIIRVEPLEQSPAVAVSAPPPQVEVLYADEHLAVIDKPAGLPVHAGAGRAARPTLVDSLCSQFPALTGLETPAPHRPGLVHRLDADTSGVMVIGLDAPTVQALLRLFRTRRVVKQYLALVHGRLPVERAIIEAPVGRDPTSRIRMAVTRQGGRPAQTGVRVREHLAGASLIEADLLTGRTHQIRVHLASIGHPVIGDRTYGPRRAMPGVSRQMLHAWRLSFEHPVSGEALSFEAPLPKDFCEVLARLRP